MTAWMPTSFIASRAPRATRRPRTQAARAQMRIEAAPCTWSRRHDAPRFSACRRCRACVRVRTRLRRTDIGVVGVGSREPFVYSAQRSYLLVATEGALINPIVSAHRLLTVTIAVIVLIGWGVRLI